MANRAVVVNLLVRTGQFTSGLQRASHDMASETTNMQTKMRALQMQVGLVGVALTGLAATAVVQWAKFDQAMTRTRAVSEDAAKRMDELNEAAKSDEVIELGYSALEASDSIYELTKAGVGASDIIGGALTGALSLAAIEAMDAGDAASILSSALTQFGLHGPDAAHVADLLAAGAAKAQGSAHDLGLALKQSGLVANQFGLSIEQTTGTLAFFANAGLIGSDAGTSLRTMLLHLAGPSTKAAELMKEIGLEVYQANGEMVDTVTLADNLQESLGKLSEEQRNQALATIFGADATRAASLLYREGGDKVQEWTDKVNDAGYATEAAATMMDNLNGDVKKLSSTWQRSMISMGESADGPLRKIVQGVTEVVDWFGELPPAVQTAMLALVGGGGLLTLAVLGIAQVVSALKTLQAGMVATGVITQATATKMKMAFAGMTKVLTGAAVGITVLAGLKAAILAFADSTREMSVVRNELVGLGRGINSLTGPIADAIDSGRTFDELIEDLDRASDARDRLGEHWWNVGVLIDSGMSVATDGMDDAYQGLKQLDEAMGEFATVDLGTAQSQFLALGEAMGATSSEDFQTLLDMMPEYQKSLLDTASAAGVNLEENDLLKLSMGDLVLVTDETTGAVSVLTTAQADMAEGAAAVTAAEVEAREAHEKYVAAIVDSFTDFFGLGDVYQGVIDKQKEWAEEQADLTKTSKDSWEDFYDGQSVSVDQYISELQAQVEAQEQWAGNLLSLTGRVKDEMPADLQAAAQEMIEELRALGPEGAAQVALLESMSEPELQSVVELYRRQGAASGAAWAEEVESAENPEVDADTESAQQKIADIRAEKEELANRTLVPIDADTQAALDKLAAVQGRVNALNGATVNVRVTGGGGGGGGVSGGAWASGGEVAGPGTGTSDSIPALLSNGEHVLTASDVQKAGGQDSVYRMRAAIQSGMLRFASGGAVGSGANGHSWAYWDSVRLDRGEILDLQIRIRDLKKELATTGKDRLTGLDRDKANYELQQAEKELKEGLYANDLNKKKSLAKRIEERTAYLDSLEEEKERKARVAEQKADYAQDIRRGEFKDDLTGGLSGAYSAIDQIRDRVLPDLVGGQKTALADALKAAEKNAEKLYSGLDRVNGQLEKATEQADELRSISDKVQSSLTGGFSLADSLNGDKVAAVNPFTGAVSGGTASSGQGMLQAAQAYASKVKVFSGKLKSLADRGFAGVILQEIAAMGVEAGIPAADALLTLDPSDTSAMNKAYEDISAFAGQAGQAVTEGFYDGGLAAADGVVAGLEAKKGDIEDAILNMALNMQKALKKALGIASPSRRFRAMMKFVGDGVVLGLDDQAGAVADASARLFGGVTVPGGSGGYGAVGSAGGSGGDITASLTDAQIERLAVAFETGNVRNINAATTQQNRKVVAAYGARGR